MENSAEPSSSISFTSTSHLSNGSTSNKVYPSGGSEAGLNLEIISLSKLSCNLGQLLSEPGGDFSDAEIVVEESSVGVHRCILAARSKFFNDLFKKDKFVGKEGKPRYHMANLLPYGKVGYEAFAIFLSYLYTGKLKPSPLEVSTCVDNSCPHDACRPAIDFAVELMCASTIFQVSELVSLFQVTYLQESNDYDYLYAFAYEMFAFIGTYLNLPVYSAFVNHLWELIFLAIIDVIVNLQLF